MPPQIAKAWKYLKRKADFKFWKYKLCELELYYKDWATNMLNHLFKHDSETIISNGPIS